MFSTVLILPGIGNSGPLHWQTLWEKSHPDFMRVQQRDWDNPVCEEWAAALEAAAKRAGPQVVLVAHSLACLTIAHWAARPHAPVAGALLVAVPDQHGPNWPGQIVGFGDTPMPQFDFPSTVVISSDDPYASVEHTEQLARAWGSRVVHIGKRGHINADSGLGEWNAGYDLLEQLRDYRPASQ
jgi:predicted alpha/beta hydrolase family esterase